MAALTTSYVLKVLEILSLLPSSIFCCFCCCKFVDNRHSVSKTNNAYSRERNVWLELGLGAATRLCEYYNPSECGHPSFNFFSVTI